MRAEFFRCSTHISPLINFSLLSTASYHLCIVRVHYTEYSNEVQYNGFIIFGAL